MKKANDIHIAIKTCLSFYNEKTDCNSDISAKDIYDKILTTKHHQFFTTDEDILYPLSSFITKIDDISDCDIIIACDNSTAKLAISLGKYCIIIADKLYLNNTNKNCVKLNINDKNLYGKIGKTYHKFTKQIKQNIQKENDRFYNIYRTSDHKKLYQYSLLTIKKYKYYAAIRLLNDIPQNALDVDALSLLLKLYYQMEEDQKFLTTITLLMEKNSLNYQEAINYLFVLINKKKWG